MKILAIGMGRPRLGMKGGRRTNSALLRLGIDAMYAYYGGRTDCRRSTMFGVSLGIDSISRTG